MRENRLFAKLYSSQTAIFPARGSSKPLPYNVKTDFCDKIIFPDKSVFCTLFVIFAKIKEHAVLKWQVLCSALF